MTPMTLLLTAVLALPVQTGKPHATHKARKPARYTATAYCIKGKTHAGTHTKRGIVAADPRVLPFGSVVRVDGLGRKAQTFVVTDSGAAVKGRHLDIFMRSCAAAKRFGKRTVTARLVGTVDLDPADGR
jgi:3D (Asp-Asp-Asp) domain-containing protein